MQASSGRRFAWGLVILIAIAHYDFWYWDDRTLVFGFVPIGLAFQAGISILAGVAWALVVKLDWPEHLERWADEPGPGERGDDSH